MKFVPLPISGAFLLEQEPFFDTRGTFSRQFCQNELAQAGLPAFTIRQCNLSLNPHRGTLRGLHYQKFPHPEPKIITCLAGKVFDVLVDLRQESPSYHKWHAVELDNPYTSVYIPPLVAHGFQTMEDNTTLYYQLGEFFYPEDYAGVNCSDPKLAIAWPFGPDQSIISARDASYPLL